MAVGEHLQMLAASGSKAQKEERQAKNLQIFSASRSKKIKSVEKLSKILDEDIRQETCRFQQWRLEMEMQNLQHRLLRVKFMVATWLYLPWA